MATSMIVHPSPSYVEDEDSASRSQTSYLASQPTGFHSNTFSQTEVSSFSLGSLDSYSTMGSGSFDACSIDSIGRMLVQLEDNDTSLTQLIIDCTKMSEEAAAEIGYHLLKNKRLKILRLLCGDTPIHRQIFQKVISGLKANTSIESIEIQCADFDREAASWLVPPLKHSQTLRHLCMVDCKGSGLEVLFVAIQQNQRIQRLTFQSCGWEDYNTDIMASSLPLVNLHSLLLHDVNIPIDGWPYLCAKIGECRDLKVLDLSWNEMDSSIVYLLANSLMDQMQVSTLSLSSCGLDDQCMEELANGLRCHPSLTSLNISYNTHISDQGVMYLKDLLLFNNSILDLNVTGCCFDDQSIEAFGLGLRYNNSYLKSFCSFDVFDILFDSCINPPMDEHEKQGLKPIKEPAHNDNDSTKEERDAISTKSSLSAVEERSQVDSTCDNSHFSIITEAHSTRTLGKRSVRSKKGILNDKALLDSSDMSARTGAYTIRTNEQRSIRNRKGKQRRTKIAKAQTLNAVFQS